MESNPTLFEEKIKLYKEAGLSDDEIKMLHCPFNIMPNGGMHLAVAGRDKFDDYMGKKYREEN